MAKIVTLKNSNDEEVYPITTAEAVNGCLYADSEGIPSAVTADITSARIADGAVTADKIDWTTSTLWSGTYYSTGASTAQFFSETLEPGRLYVIEVFGLSSSWKMQFPFIYTGEKSMQFSYYDGSSYARWRVAINSAATAFYLDTNSTNMGANTAITKFMRVM